MLVLSSQLSTSRGRGCWYWGGGIRRYFGFIVSNVSLRRCVTFYPLGSIKTIRSFSGTYRIWPLVAKTQVAASDLSGFELVSQWCGSQLQGWAVISSRNVVHWKGLCLWAAGRSFTVLDHSWVPLQIFISSSLSGCLAGAVNLISGNCLLGKPKNRSRCVFLLECGY